MMTVASTDGIAVEQEHFLRTFLQNNVRSRAEFILGQTRSESVDFAIWLQWDAFIEWYERHYKGAYAGDSGTVYVNGQSELQANVDAYASHVLAQDATYSAVDSAVRRLDDYGFRAQQNLKVRNEARNFAWVYTCGHCGGHGEVSCHRCAASGRMTCISCSGDGRTRCTRCGGNGYLTRTEYRYVGSQSQSVQVQERCSCISGRVQCSTCSGAGKVRCTMCSGSGRVMCDACAGSGKLSTVRTMALVARPKRFYDIGPGVSAFASSVLESYAPTDLPTSTYTGSWSPESQVDDRSHTISYVMNAKTRFLSSDVELDGGTFLFRTFGRTLHVADGGGLVEHLLDADRQDLKSAVSVRALHAVANPVRWMNGLIRGARRIVESKINVALLERSLGDLHSEHVANAVSSDYEREVVSSLKTALKRIHFTLSTLLWIAAYLTTAIVLGVQWRRVSLHPASAHQVHLAVLSVPYYVAAIAAASAALVYFLSRTIPVIPFVDEHGSIALRCLSLVRGRTRWKAVVLVTGLSLATLAVYIFARL